MEQSYYNWQGQATDTNAEMINNSGKYMLQRIPSLSDPEPHFNSHTQIGLGMNSNVKFDPDRIPDSSYSHLPLPDDEYDEFFDLNLDDFEMNDSDILKNLETLVIPTIPQETQLQHEITNTLTEKSKIIDSDEITNSSNKRIHQRKLSGTAIFGFHNHDKTLLPENTNMVHNNSNNSLIKSNDISSIAPPSLNNAENVVMLNKEISEQQVQLKEALEKQKLINLKLEEQLKQNQLEQEKLASELQKQKQYITSPNRHLTKDGQIFITSNSPQGIYKFPPPAQASPIYNNYSNNSSPLRPPREQQQREMMDLEVAQSYNTTTLDGSPIRKPQQIHKQHFNALKNPDMQQLGLQYGPGALQSYGGNTNNNLENQHNDQLRNIYTQANAQHPQYNYESASYEDNKFLESRRTTEYHSEEKKLYYNSSDVNDSQMNFGNNNNCGDIRNHNNELRLPKQRRLSHAMNTNSIRVGGRVNLEKGAVTMANLLKKTDATPELQSDFFVSSLLGQDEEAKYQLHHNGHNNRVKSTASNSTSHSTIPQPLTPTTSSLGNSDRFANQYPHSRAAGSTSGGTSHIGLGLMVMDPPHKDMCVAAPSNHNLSKTFDSGDARRSSVTGAREELLQSIVLQPPSLTIDGFCTGSDNGNNKQLGNDSESKFKQKQTPSPILKSQEKFDNNNAFNFESSKKHQGTDGFGKSHSVSPKKRVSSSSSTSHINSKTTLKKNKDLYITPKLQCTPIFGSGEIPSSVKFCDLPVPSAMTKYVSIPSPMSNVSAHSSPRSKASPQHGQNMTGDYDQMHNDEDDHAHDSENNELGTGNVGEMGSVTIGIINMSPKRIRKSTTLPPGSIDQYVVELPDKTFVCNYNKCWKNFHRRYNIRAHIQTHLQDKPHGCDFPGCDKAFVRNHDLQRHKKSHLAKIHNCECGKKFSKEELLQNHKSKKTCRVMSTNIDTTTTTNSTTTTEPAGISKSPKKRTYNKSKPSSLGSTTTNTIGGATAGFASPSDSSLSTSPSTHSTNSLLPSSGDKLNITSSITSNMSHTTSPVKINIRKNIEKNGERDMLEKVEKLLKNKSEVTSMTSSTSPTTSIPVVTLENNKLEESIKKHLDQLNNVYN